MSVFRGLAGRRWQMPTVLVRPSVVRSRNQVKPYRKNGDNLPESLFIGRVRRLFVNLLAATRAGCSQLPRGRSLSWVLPLMACAYLLGNFFEHKWLAWPVTAFLVVVYPVLLYRWLGPVPCGLVVSSLLFILVDTILR